MFKYQHVSSGEHHYFIVTCPYASDPRAGAGAGADAYAHAKIYPDMVALGFDLMTIAAGVVAGGGGGGGGADAQGEDGARAPAPQIKVGVSSGPAAGVVLGRCRRFYCVYGDTINTAARMCAAARPRTVRVTADIGQHPSVLRSRWFASQGLGRVPVKGKGAMDVYEIQVKTETFFGRALPVREAVIARRRVSREDINAGVERSEPAAAAAAAAAALDGILQITGGGKIPSEGAPQSSALLALDIQQFRSSCESQE